MKAKALLGIGTVLMVGALIVGFLAGAAFMQPDNEQDLPDLVSLYCMAVADTGAASGAIPNNTAYFQFVDACAGKIIQQRTFWDFPLQHGIEYMLELYVSRLEQINGGASGNLHS